MLARRDFLKLFGAFSLHHCAHLLGIHQLAGRKSGSDLPNIQILVLDTLNASRMSLYGCKRETTPNIQRLAARANVYHRHYAGGNFTSPGTASLLMGTYPWSHRGINMYGSVLKEKASQNLFSALPDRYYRFAYTQNPLVMVLLDQFKDAIDKLPAITETSLTSDSLTNWFQGDFRSAFWGDSILRGRDSSYLPTVLFLSVVNKFREALGQAFPPRDLRNLYPKGVPHNYKGSTFILEEAIDWLQVEIKGHPRPFCSYVHLWPPHEPYWPRKDFVNYFKKDQVFQAKPDHFFSARKTRGELEQAQREYDSYLAYTDAEVGRLLDNLAQQGTLDDTIFILTSDHGQAFEKGIEGHLTPVLFESLIRIPLIISMPGQTERRDIFSATSAVDILPTLLTLCGQPVPVWCQGHILPGFSSPEEGAGREIYALEAKENSKFGPFVRGSLAMVAGDYKLIRYIGHEGYEDKTECYHLRNDPEELNNLYPADPTAQSLKERVDQIIIEINRSTTS